MTNKHDFDVIIVGGSIAGCSAATFLGRRGLRVLVIERASNPAAYKKVCTHFIQASANATIRRLGLEDAILRAGAQPNRCESWTPNGWITWPEGLLAGYNIRREVLDPMLRNLAAQTPGVTLWLGHNVKGLIETPDAVSGVIVETEGSAPREVRAKLVVAADGRNGKLGALSGTNAVTSPNGRFFYFAYYENLELASGDASMIWFGDPETAYCFRNDAKLTVAAVMPTKARLPQFRDNVEKALQDSFDALPYGPKLREAKRASEIFGMVELPNHARPPSARGMAFIGDAALTSDPLFGIGCGWALQSAEWLADTVGPVLQRDDYASQLGPALARYAKLHGERLNQHHGMITDLSTGRRFNPVERALFRGASRDETLARGFLRVAARIDQPSDFLTPKTLARIAAVNLLGKAPGATAPRRHNFASEHAPVVLQKFIPAWGLPDLSPFCFKAEAYLQLARIPYSTVLGDSRKAPKGKLPVLLDGAQTIADSSAIIEHLEATRAQRLDGFLTARQRAVQAAVKGMLEEQFYFVIVYQRWKQEHDWHTYQPLFLQLAAALGIPGPLRGAIVRVIRQQMLKALNGQGIGRHTPDEVVDIGKRIIDSVAQLCEGPFFFGDKPSSLDATVYAFLQSVISAPFEGPLKEHLCSNGKLRTYCEHVARACAGDASTEPQASVQSAIAAAAARAS